MQRLGSGLALRQLDAFKKQLEEGRLGVICEGTGSALWRMREIAEILKVEGIRVLEVTVPVGEAWHYFRLVHNLPRDAMALFETASFKADGEAGRESWGSALRRCLTLCIKAGLAQWKLL